MRNYSIKSYPNQRIRQINQIKNCYWGWGDFLDIFNNNNSLGLGEVGKLGNFFNFDSNGDGF
ncbi:hypothetical protein [uncultured Helicobacter sp.]|uniref:hypothetical protein n=1 Tax=uncultured Helicobacter sp. TaxID=175537 RepID=UPI00261F1DA0|nr:hypothetical protein [uncultured Helicobacter sp.]